MKNLPRTFRRLIPFALAAGLAALAALPLDASVGIARRGRALARVVVAPDAAETERFAAGELSLFLHIVTGADFPVREAAAPEGANLLVGPGAALRSGHGMGSPGLLPEEIVVRTSGRDLVLAGGSPRATLYAVYTFLEDIVGWAKIAGRLYIWDYTTDFSHYVQPHPNYGVLASNIRLFAGRNVRGVFEQGAYQSWGSEMAELRAWALAKLLWDPLLDGEALREEFLVGYYGPAAGAVGEFLKTLEKAVELSGDALGCYSPPDAGFLSLGTLLRSQRILDAARKKARRSAE